MFSDHPIGIFDSGIGGLTVAREIISLLPHEHIIYFGDTAHLPYGDKSAAAIQSYSVKIAHMLLEQKCKMIVIACHSASATAYELVKEYVGSRAIVINVIDPVIHMIQKNYAKKTVGLIGTKSTVQSNLYKKNIDALDLSITFHAHMTPLLAPAIEEGFHSGKVINSILDHYLSHVALSSIDALVLGCTHYPVVKKNIAAYYQNRVTLIDPSEQVAHRVAHVLQQRNLCNLQQSPGTKQFFVSDFTTNFADNAKLFFEDPVSLTHYPLWE